MHTLPCCLYRSSLVPRTQSGQVLLSSCRRGNAFENHDARISGHEQSASVVHASICFLLASLRNRHCTIARDWAWSRSHELLRHQQGRPTTDQAVSPLPQVPSSCWFCWLLTDWSAPETCLHACIASGHWLHMQLEADQTFPWWPHRLQHHPNRPNTAFWN